MRRILGAVLFWCAAVQVSAEPVPLVWGAEGVAQLAPGYLWSLDRPTVMVPPLNFPIELWLDEEKVFEPPYPVTGEPWRTNHVIGVPLVLEPGTAEPVLRLRIVRPPAATEALPPLLLGSRAEVSRWYFWNQFFGPWILFGTSFASLVLALGGVLIYRQLDRPRSPAVLWFVASCVAFVVSWSPYVVDYIGVPVFFLLKVSITGVMVWYLCLAMVLLDFLGQGEAWRRVSVVLFASAVVVAGTVLPAGDVESFQRARLLWIAVFLVQFAVISVGASFEAIRRRSFRRIGLLAILVVLPPVLLLHDAGVLVGYRPPILMAPYASGLLFGFLLLNLGRDWLRARRQLVVRSQELADLNSKLHAEVDARNEDLSHFVSVLSHDMKNTLYGLRQVTRQLSSGPPPGPAVLEALDQTVQRIQGVLQSLLNLSSSTIGVLQPDLAEVTAGELWDRLEAEVAEDAQRKDVRIERIGDEHPRLTTDPTMATTILRNFFGNALKVSPPGASIRLLTRMSDSEVVLAVIDSGPGLSGDQVAGLFDLESRRVKLEPGQQPKGFGLILAKNLADRLGHRIDVRSTPRVGSSFALVVRR